MIKIDEEKKEFIGKKCRIEIHKDKRRLNFTGEIISISDKLIMFRDKFGILYSFHIDMVREVEEVV